MATSQSHASEQIAPATIAFLCPGCSNRLTVPVSLAGVTGPCPHCATVIESPSVPVVQSIEAKEEPMPVVPQNDESQATLQTHSVGIQPRGGARAPKINIRSVGTIGWASEEAREASRRVRADVTNSQRLEHRIEKITSSDRFENARALLSIAAVITMAGTIFFMAKTGWGSPNAPTSEAAGTTEAPPHFVSANTQSAERPASYPWREPLPEVERGKDDPFYRE